MQNGPECHTEAQGWGLIRLVDDYLVKPLLGSDCEAVSHCDTLVPTSYIPTTHLSDAVDSSAIVPYTIENITNGVSKALYENALNMTEELTQQLAEEQVDQSEKVSAHFSQMYTNQTEEFCAVSRDFFAQNMTQMIEDSIEQTQSTMEQAMAALDDNPLVTIGLMVATAASLVGAGIWWWTRSAPAKAEVQEENSEEEDSDYDSESEAEYEEDSDDELSEEDELDLLVKKQLEEIEKAAANKKEIEEKEAKEKEAKEKEAKEKEAKEKEAKEKEAKALEEKAASERISEELQDRFAKLKAGAEKLKVTIAKVDNDLEDSKVASDEAKKALELARLGCRNYLSHRDTHREVREKQKQSGDRVAVASLLQALHKKGHPGALRYNHDGSCSEEQRTLLTGMGLVEKDGRPGYFPSGLAQREAAIKKMADNGYQPGDTPEYRSPEMKFI